MKLNKSIYESPQLFVEMLLTESVFASSIEYGKAGSDGKVLYDDFEY